MSEQQGFPNIGAPIANLNNGGIEQAWLQLLITLWNRTGAAQGNATVKPGAMLQYAGDAIPAGYFLCDGSEVSRSQYPNLFSAIHTIWGSGDGVGTFNLPNLVDRFLVGAGGQYAVGDIGGADEITLTVEQLAPHAHAIDDPGHTHVFTGDPHTHVVTDPGHFHAITDPTHNHGVTDPGHTHTDNAAASNVLAGAVAGGGAPGSTGSATTGITINNAATGITINTKVTGVTNQDTVATGTNADSMTGITVLETGEGDPIDIRPQYAAIYYIIKY